MKKRMKIVDVLASVMLVGVVSAMAIAQVGGGDPVPWMKVCPPGVVTIGGALYFYDEITCFFGADCGYAIVVNSETGQITVEPRCVYNV
jgi:hypothetical protein